MTSIVDAVSLELPNASQDDLKKLQSLVNMLLKTGSSGTAETVKQTRIEDSNEFLVYEAVRMELSNLGINNVMPFNQLADSKYAKRWYENLKVLNNFIDRHFLKHLANDIQRLKLTRIIIRTMVGEFKERGIPVSFGSIVNNLHRTPQTFDRAFPFYIESGLAYMIPAMLLRNGKK